MHNEKGQWVDESNNNGLYQKSFVQDKWAILDPKMAHPRNSGSALRIFLKFCRMKGADRYMKILLVAFQEKIHPLGYCLLFDWAWSNWARPLLIESLNSPHMISFMIATGSINSQNMIRILKHWRHDFSGKHLFDGYFMDIMRCLCVDVKIHGFVKLL